MNVKNLEKKYYIFQEKIRSNPNIDLSLIHDITYQPANKHKTDSKKK